MLLDPFEEQLDLPAAAIKLADGQCGQHGVVGEQHDRLARFVVFDLDASERLREAEFGIEHLEQHGLVAHESGAAVHSSRVAALEVEVGASADNKEGPRFVKAVQALEIEEGAIHDIEGAWFGNQLIQDIDLVQSAIADVNESRDGSAQVQQCVQLHRRLGRAIRCPGKQRQAQPDQRGIERVDRVLEFHSEGFVCVERACGMDEPLSKRGIDSPIACFVGIGQGAARDSSRDAHVIQLGFLCPQARFDVAQTLPVAQLRKRHAAKLARAAEVAYPMIATITLHDATEALPRKMIHELGEHQFAAIHARHLGLGKPHNDALRGSSRRHPQIATLLQQFSSLRTPKTKLTGQH